MVYAVLAVRSPPRPTYWRWLADTLKDTEPAAPICCSLTAPASKQESQPDVFCRLPPLTADFTSEVQTTAFTAGAGADVIVAAAFATTGAVRLTTDAPIVDRLVSRTSGPVTAAALVYTSVPFLKYFTAVPSTARVNVSVATNVPSFL